MRFDAVVVGAGLGGLAAATALRRAGLSVLVLDGNPHPGGTAWNFRRRGFAFPMGPLGFSRPGQVREVLDRLGSPGPFPLSRVHYRLRAFGLDLPLSLPFAREAKELARAFPGEGAAIGAFFAAAGSPEGTGAAEDVPASAWLAARVRDPRLRRVLGSMGSDEPYSGLPLLAAMWRLLGEEGIWTPCGEGLGAGALAQRLLQAFRAAGGEVRLGTPVARIVVEGGRAIGVALADGGRVEAGAVVANADFKRTFLGLLGEGDTPASFRHAVERARLTRSIVQLSLGVDASRLDLSGFNTGNRILWRAPGAEEIPPPSWGEPFLAPGELAAQELEVALVSADDPLLAPPGAAGLVVRVAAEYRHFARFRTGFRRRTADYRGYKERLADELVAAAGAVAPGLRAAVRVRELSTPLTFEDQGGRSEGAVAGWSWDWRKGGAGAPRDLTLAPVAGLYMAGHQASTALFSGGVPTALAAGLAAAARLLEEAGPEDDLSGFPDATSPVV